MQQPKKTWVLDQAPHYSAKTKQVGSGGLRRVQPARRRYPRRPKPHGSGIKVFLSYVLGPFGLLVVEEGRQSGFWTAVSVISGLGWIAMAVLGFTLLDGRGPERSLMTMAAFGLTAVVGCVAWSRGVWLAGTAPGWKGFPSWMTHPIPAFLLGLFLPGLGIFAVGSRRLGATCLWLLGLLVFPLVTLLMAPGIWVRLADPQGAMGVKLETLFIFAVLAVLVLGAVWILQAAAGAMMAGASRSGAGFMGNGLGFLLAVAVVAFALNYQPRTLASELDDYAVALGQDGLRVIPLRLCQLAARLDPVAHLYPMHAAGFHEALGEMEQAQRIRAGLDRRWEAYAQARLQVMRAGLTRKPPAVLDSMPPPPACLDDAE